MCERELSGRVLFRRVVRMLQRVFVEWLELYGDPGILYDEYGLWCGQDVQRQFVCELFFGFDGVQLFGFDALCERIRSLCRVYVRVSVRRGQDVQFGQLCQLFFGFDGV